jgi:succinate dehydrogenase / fumarate reductase, cytochrome b subunit
MSWFSKFMTSSIGQKVVMALTGLFLMLFLIVHLIGNLQLLAQDGGESFNSYAYLMTHNIFIKTISYSLYAFILWHAVQGLWLWSNNRKAATGVSRYGVTHTRASERSSRNMAWFGIIILVFILLHMWQFWLKMKMGVLPPVDVAGYDHPVADLYTPVKEAFSNLGYVVFYVISMVIIGLHLWHGFWSSFQTLGLSHKKYTPIIKVVGYAYSILVPLGFAIIPLLMYFRSVQN